MAKNQGIKSRNLVHPNYRTGTGANRVQKAGVAQLGQHVGDHATAKGRTGYTGERLTSNAPTFDPVPYGNAVAASTQCGPGGSRRVMGSGSQGTHGSPAPGNAPKAPALWPGWERK